MQSLHDFIIKPVGDNRYNNSKKIAGVDFVTNTRIEAFQNVNREAVVIALPKCVETTIQVGDKVTIEKPCNIQWESCANQLKSTYISIKTVKMDETMQK